MLDKILEHKRQEVAHLKTVLPLSEIKERLKDLPPGRNFYQALLGNGVQVIAEIKKASPVQGVIRPSFEPSQLARAYTRGGAAAISVLTEERFFQGSLVYLQKVRASTPLPLLRKDFLVDEYQIYESRLQGADAVLLIVAALYPSELEDYLAMARELGMAALVEVHNEEEVQTALEAGAEIIGINNRDLHSLKVNLGTTLRLRPLIPEDRLVVSESGIWTQADVEILAGAGVDAVLVGTALMKAGDVEAKLRELTCFREGKSFGEGEDLRDP
ncbi:MAG: Indole-3-glycerol phosphate synthase [Thermoanaerobacterales bacterium 50_218]|nr:MAG: Indole-3-glycerol phosphate synthase [Thermoanaerobacterales bacterium 50_218]HAA89723.1 indole-3-glycerol phosphate synthase TrpC [Peptococcaceae bacterium]